MHRLSLFLFGTGLLCALWLSLAGWILLFMIERPLSEWAFGSWIRYAWFYGVELQDSLFLSGILSFGGLLIPIAGLIQGRERPLYGRAGLATLFDTARAGLFAKKGIVLGRKNGRLLVFDGAQHVLMSAPTRSGKGVGIVIPNLLHWPDSVVVLDIKQENWRITSRYRSKALKQACFLFNPAATDGRSHRYNPLAYIERSNPGNRMDDVQKIASMLFPDREGTDVIWTATPRALFTGIVSYLLDCEGEEGATPVTMGQVLRESLKEGDGSDYFERIMEERRRVGKPLSEATQSGLNSYVSIKSENTRAGVIGSFRSRLEIWLNPLVDAATSGNDFDLKALRSKPMSIYVGVTPDNLERMGPILNLFFQQLIDLNTRSLPGYGEKGKLQCLLLMDEFTSLGKVSILNKGIAYIAGYGLRMLPIIQSPSQLVDVYGRDAAQTFQSNHAVSIIFPPKASETQTARDISEWLGYETVCSRSRSRGTGLFVNNRSGSENLSDQRRALLLPQEITSLGSKVELVIAENTPPIKAEKIRYFEDGFFLKKLANVSRTMARRRSLSALNQAIAAHELAIEIPLIEGVQLPTTPRRQP
jgi:type IV secretion system protein VirD4